MKKILLAALFSLAAAALFAYDAEVLSVQGKAQHSKDGTSWTPLSQGSLIGEGVTIQTGFKSSLKIKFKGTVVDLGPMTRIKVDELSESESKDNAALSMKVGSVLSNVKKVEDRRAGFTVRGPAVTASVRGTIVKEECGYNRDTVTAIESVTAVWPTSKGEKSAQEISDASNSASSVSGGRAADGALSLSQGQSTSGEKHYGLKKPYGYANENSTFVGGSLVNMAFGEAVGGNPFDRRYQNAPAGSAFAPASQSDGGIALSVVLGTRQ
ncbi:MAG: FecR domain-containing protein [Treponema sp.]|nr:FecR domain-containing protein [Treponema sp.]MBQ7620454.1 FecR domain-containing protein [Treponema sp.]